MAATKIPHENRSGVNVDAGHSKIYAFGFPALAKILRPRIQITGTSDRARRIVGLIPGGIEENVKRVTDNLGNGAFVSTRDVNPAMSVRRAPTSRQCGRAAWAHDFNPDRRDVRGAPRCELRRPRCTIRR